MYIKKIYNIKGFRSSRLFFDLELFAHSEVIPSSKKKSFEKDIYGYIINFSNRQFEQSDLSKGLKMLMQGVNFYFVEDGEYKFDSLVVEELESKSQVDASNVFKSNKQKHTKFSGFEKNINLLFEINKGTFAQNLC